MPWGITMAGLFPGIILNLLMSGLCLYTAYRLVVAHAYHGKEIFYCKISSIDVINNATINYIGGGANVEVLDLCRIYLGKWAEHIARIFSIAVLLGATIAYWILMANFLYNSVNFVYGKYFYSKQDTSSYRLMKYRICFVDSIAGWSTHPVFENISYKEGIHTYTDTKFNLFFENNVLPLLGFITSITVLCPKEARDNNTIVTYEKTFDALGPAWDLRNTVPVFLALLIFPLLNFNSTTFFTKFNSLGEYIHDISHPCTSYTIRVFSRYVISYHII